MEKVGFILLMLLMYLVKGKGRAIDHAIQRLKVIDGEFVYMFPWQDRVSSYGNRLLIY